MEAAGNRFVVVDALTGPPPRDASALAVEVCENPGGLWKDGEKGPAHGLLLLFPGADSGSGSLRMVVHNADGSRAEACGNGLRCVGVWAVARGQAASGRLVIETDGGQRWVDVDQVASRARSGLGPVQWVRRGLEVQLDGVRQQADHLSLTNPHAVVLVDSVEGIPLAAWAAEVEVQGGFPDGVNVEFVERRPLPGGGLRVRVHERGVGETGSCGTGACAVANVARERLCASLPLEVHFPGGVLRVGETEHGEAWVEGPVWMATRAETDEKIREDGAAEERSAAVESTEGERGRAAEWVT